jgi:hypothetical protein
MVAKSLLPLKDGEDGGEGATNVHTSQRELARDRVTRRRESGAEACGTEGCYTTRRVCFGGGRGGRQAMTSAKRAG